MCHDIYEGVTVVVLVVITSRKLPQTIYASYITSHPTASPLEVNVHFFINITETVVSNCIEVLRHKLAV